MIISTDFTNTNKITKIKKSWPSGTLIAWLPDCLAKTNLTGSSYFKQITIWTYPFHVTILIYTNTFLIGLGDLDIYCHIICNMWN